jgi:Secretion system C-terminal sorting domain
MVLIVLGTNSGFSQSGSLLFNENFTGLNDGDLGSANGNWNNRQNQNRVQVASTSSLFHPLVISGSQYVNIKKLSNGDDPYKLFSNNLSIPATANTVVYLSFLVKVNNPAFTTSAGNSTQVVLALGDNGSNNRLGFFIGNDGNGTNNLKFGIKKSGNNSATYAGGSYAFGATHLVIIKYVYVSGNNNDLMYMWVNPTSSIFGGELPVSSAVLSVNNGSDNQTVLNSVGFEQSNNGADAFFDCLKISYAVSTNGSSGTANGASAWSILSPGTVVLPVKFGAISAKPIRDAIKIEWETFSDESTGYYEVQRSFNGQDFKTIGYVNSRNSVERSLYESIDDKPLRGTNFYRLHSVGIDGASVYSVVLKITTGQVTESGMNLFPNPVKGGQLSLQLSNLSDGIYSVQVFDLAGTMVHKQSIRYSGATFTQTIKLPETIKEGNYSIIVTNGNTRMYKSITLVN